MSIRTLAAAQAASRPLPKLACDDHVAMTPSGSCRRRLTGEDRDGDAMGQLGRRRADSGAVRVFEQAADLVGRLRLREEIALAEAAAERVHQLLLVRMLDPF